MMYPLTSCQTNSVADESCPQFSGNEGNVFESRKFEPDRYPFSRNATHNNDVFMISKLQTTNKNMLQQKWWSSSQKSWTKTFFGFMNHWLFSQAWWEFEHQGRAATSYPVVHGSTDVGAVMSIMILDHLRDPWHCEQDYEQMSNDANWVHESCIYKAAFLLLCWPLAIWANQEPTAITCSLKWRAKCLFGIDKEAILASHFVVQIQWLPHGHYIAELKFAISLKVLLFVKPFYLFSWRSQRSLSPNYTTLLPG